MSTKGELQSALGDLFDPEAAKSYAEIDLGKLDRRSGFKNHRVELLLSLSWIKHEFSNKPDEFTDPHFSVIGEVVNTRKRNDDNIDACGQIQDALDGFVSHPQWETLLRLWNTHHLNNMHAECEHMRDLGWVPLPGERMPMIEVNGDKKFIGHVYEEEHPQGILKKECPTCGYRYGTDWLYVAIPQDDLEEIMNLMVTLPKTKTYDEDHAK